MGKKEIQICENLYKIKDELDKDTITNEDSQEKETENLNMYLLKKYIKYEASSEDNAVPLKTKSLVQNFVQDVITEVEKNKNLEKEKQQFIKLKESTEKSTTNLENKDNTQNKTIQQQNIVANNLIFKKNTKGTKSKNKDKKQIEFASTDVLTTMLTDELERERQNIDSSTNPNSQIQNINI